MILVLWKFVLTLWCDVRGRMAQMTRLTDNEQHREVIFQVRDDGVGQDGDAVDHGVQFRGAEHGVQVLQAGDRHT